MKIFGPFRLKQYLCSVESSRGMTTPQVTPLKYNQTMNVFHYSASCEAMFENYLRDTSGYVRKTTFYSDLSIAEYMEGKKGINETYKNVMKSWIGNIEYITEFCMALNIKSWQMYNEGKQELASLYADLYYKCKDAIYKHYKGDQKSLDYFFDTTD